MMRQLFAILLLCFSLNSLAVLSAVEEGATWLSGNQQPDGGVYTSDDLAIDKQSTAEVIVLSKEDISLATDDAAALQFLQSKLSDSLPHQTQFVARALKAGLTNDANGEDLLPQLLDAQNEDGGFGDKPDYQSTVYDTAFALTALSGIEESNYQKSRAVGFLLANQNTDGSWSLSGNPDVVAIPCR